MVQGSVQLYIRVTHTIGGVDTHQVLTDDLLIDNLFIEVANLTSFSPLTPVELFIGEAGRVEAELQFGVVCDGNCYGPDCSVECNSRNDATAHYRCDRNGDWECMDGYQDLATNCTKCLPAVGCCEHTQLQFLSHSIIYHEKNRCNFNFSHIIIV